MGMVTSLLLAVVLAVISSTPSFAQPASPNGVTVPRVITVTGVFQPADGQPARAVETVTLSVYAGQSDTSPLWQETQTVALDAKGHYTLLLGATLADGIPARALEAGAEWLSFKFDRAGETESARTRLTSVPYSLRAADADTLGGRPASAYLLAPSTSGSGTTTGTHTATATGSSTTSNQQSPSATTNDVLPGTANYVAKYVDSVNVGPGSFFDNGTFVGLGTTTPQDFFHIRFTNTSGSFTGLAVQNLGNTATSYSGTLFYDQNGALGQFQGFNNVTHEYRINNIAQTSGVFNGSINFMVGSTSRFLVTSGGSIGIGTTTPGALLDVSNALVPTSNIANIAATSYNSNTLGSEIVGRKARGTAAAPSAVQSGDNLAFLGGKGYGTTGFGINASGASVWAAENWTDTAQGTFMNFSTSTVGTNSPQVRMTVNSNGNVGVGTGGPVANLEVSNANNTAPFGTILGSSFTGTAGSAPAGTLFVGRKARGTSAAPSAVQNGDNLVGFLGRGFGATAFSGTVGGMFVRAAENWTDTAQGTSLAFNTTATGTTSPSTKMAIDPFGDVGIGTLSPTAPLEVSRIGTDSGVEVSVYSNGNNANPFYITKFANGTPAAPTAVQTGNTLGAWVATGYGATQFGNVVGGMGVIAQESWTDTAQGSATGFLATPLGTNAAHLYAAVLPSGNVGIGDWPLPNPVPTATDKLQVFGDIRVGTSGTNGCIKNFSGTGIIGTCASDRRFKKNITPFGRVLDQLTALQPVHYYWRTTEFPEKHFGDTQAYGLIAQDVEQVLPDLVVTNADGYKAVDYSKLPLLTIQALKELKAENDALKKSSLQSVEEMKSENDALKERVAELERLVTRLLTTTSPR